MNLPLTVRCKRLLGPAVACALAVLLTQGAAAQSETGVGLDALLAGAREAVCAKGSPSCQALQAAAQGDEPCLREGRSLTVGHAVLIGADGAVTDAEYLVLLIQRAGDVVLLERRHIYSENQQEKDAAEDLIRAVQDNAPDSGNALYRYITSGASNSPQLLAVPGQRALVVQAEGPPLYLRQNERLLYAVVPGAAEVFPGEQQAREGILFAVLPVVPGCRR
jgi:hypothetical protein